VRIVENFACTGCGCVCDDLRLTVSNERITRAERACSLAEPWLLSQNERTPPVVEIDGRSVSLAEGVRRAADILQQARFPLIYGLARTNTEGQRAAVSLAASLGATIDTSASLCHAPSVMAQQQVGKVTCTLGEIRNRADVVVFWGSDPAQTHPRHWERYSVHPAGRWTPDGRSNRFVAVVDTSRTASAADADLFVSVGATQHFEALVSLRAMLRGHAVDNHEWPGLAELAQRMKSARCGVLFFGVGLARGEAGEFNVQALLQLVTELNETKRWYAMRMRVQGNVVGADSVMLWQTGYPFAVNMARGYPRYNPGEFSVQGLLEREEADACLILGTETLNWLSASALRSLQRIPTIVIDPPEAECELAPTVRFRSATPGIHLGGTVYRMDGVPVSLRPVLPTHYPSDEAILGAIVRAVEVSEV